MEKGFTIPNLPGKGVEFAFSGGPMDGQNKSCTSLVGQIPEEVDAKGYWLLTSGGKVGCKFQTVSPGYWEAFQSQATVSPDGTFTGIGAAQLHIYEIVENAIREDRAYVSCRYVGLRDGKQPEN